MFSPCKTIRWLVAIPAAVAMLCGVTCLADTPADFIPNVTLYVPTSNLSTMFQDSGSTTPVTAAGDPVYILNASPSVVFSAGADNTRPFLRSDATRNGSLHLLTSGTVRHMAAVSSAGLFNHFHVNGTGTILLWFKFDSATAPGLQAILDNRNFTSSGKGFTLYRDTSENVVYAESAGGGNILSLTLGNVADTNWHRGAIRVAVGMGASSVKLDDNAPVTGTLGSLTTGDATTDLRIGNRSSTLGTPMEGQVSELVISSGTVSPEEEALWAAYNPTFASFEASSVNRFNRIGLGIGIGL